MHRDRVCARGPLAAVMLIKVFCLCVCANQQLKIYIFFYFISEREIER